MAARADAVSPLAFYEAPKSQLNAVLSCKNYIPPPHFSFLGSLAVPIAGPPEQGEPAHPGAPHAAPRSQRLPPDRRAAGARPSALLVGTQSCRPSVARGSRGGEAGAAPGGPTGTGVGRSNSSRHVEGGEGPALPAGHSSPGGGEGESRPRGEAAVRPGCRTARLLASGGGGGAEGWGKATGATKKRPQGAEK